MFTGIFEQGVLSTPWGIAVAIGGIMAILLTVGYSFAGLRKVFFGPMPEHLVEKGDKIKDPPLTMAIPLFLVAAGSIFLGLYPSLLMDMLHSVGRAAHFERRFGCRVRCRRLMVRQIILVSGPI